MNTEWHQSGFLFLAFPWKPSKGGLSLAETDSQWIESPAGEAVEVLNSAPVGWRSNSGYTAGAATCSLKISSTFKFF